MVLFRQDVFTHGLFLEIKKACRFASGETASRMGNQFRDCSLRLGRVLAVGPGAGKLLIIRRNDYAARIAAIPADNLVLLAVLLSPGFPIAPPRSCGFLRPAAFAVPGNARPLSLDTA